MSLKLDFVSLIWLCGKLFPATRDRGASTISGASVSTGVFDEYGKLASVWCFLSVSALWGQLFDPAEIRSSVVEEQRTNSRESKQTNEDAEQEGRGSCRLSLETSGLPTVTVFLS